MDTRENFINEAYRFPVGDIRGEEIGRKNRLESARRQKNPCEAKVGLRRMARHIANPCKQKQFYSSQRDLAVIDRWSYGSMEALEFSRRSASFIQEFLSQTLKILW
jgi:hypothetical protein